MKHKIDLFEAFENKREDTDAHAKMLNIVFQGGTFGNFLKHFIECFSKATPEVDKDPFTDIGTSHVLTQKDYSGLIQKYHSYFINDNQGETDLPICLIVPSRAKHFLYLKQAQLFRAADGKASPDDLWSKAVGEMPERLQDHVAELKRLYDIKETAHFHWIPKFIVRDWYKLEFIQRLEDTYDYQWFEALKDHAFFEKQKTHHLDLESFFGVDGFIESMREMDRVFGLELDFDRLSEMKQMFNRGMELDNIRKECNMAEDVLDNSLDVDLRDLNVATEAYIYAHYEKQNPDIQMPLTNRFFRDSEEIRQFIDHYPNFYRRKNPNL